MTHPQDIKDQTRWNRGGLERFRYIDGNAVTYLETMRKNLAKAFPDWKKMSEAGEFQESDSIRLKRMIDQYKACLLYTSPSPRDLSTSRMPSSA